MKILKTSLVIFLLVASFGTMILGVAGGSGIWFMSNPFLHVMLLSMLALSGIWTLAAFAFLDE
tara:strand:+ start:1595 stop:1783 length:189 start_codon:yes stop_codon:yes gene_type:complete